MLKTSVPFHLFRQVLIVVGSLVLCGVLLGYFISPKWFILSGIIGIGMVFSGVSGFCSLLKILPLCPWNKK
ncbi:YgaP family membrane protein [Aggregatibacter kilianii]|uniref:YgaP family membrane protein n=1 Tax=Aggregatibacter kilianii TaxID=2025884 RepID=UPI000D6588D2|nr:DUF2892 domain-containing protein [Aggregatibacter kilianii]